MKESEDDDESSEHTIVDQNDQASDLENNNKDSTLALEQTPLDPILTKLETGPITIEQEGSIKTPL